MFHDNCRQLETTCVSCGGEKRSEEGCCVSLCDGCRIAAEKLAAEQREQSKVPEDPDTLLWNEWPKTGEIR